MATTAANSSSDEDQANFVCCLDAPNAFNGHCAPGRLQATMQQEQHYMPTTPHLHIFVII